MEVAAEKLPRRVRRGDPPDLGGCPATIRETCQH